MLGAGAWCYLSQSILASFVYCLWCDEMLRGCSFGLHEQQATAAADRGLYLGTLADYRVRARPACCSLLLRPRRLTHLCLSAPGREAAAFLGPHHVPHRRPHAAACGVGSRHLRARWVGAWEWLPLFGA